MKKTYIDVQKNIAKNNINFFFMKLIVKILQEFIKLAFVLLISEIFNYTIINIIVLIYTCISIYNVYNISGNYIYIIRDIKETLNINNLSFEIDLNTISNNLFKGILNYN